MLPKQSTPNSKASSYELIQDFNPFTYQYPINLHINQDIDDYLYSEVLCDNSQSDQPIYEIINQEQTHLLVTEEINVLSFSPQVSPMIKLKNKSIFHNFQKHLKTLLKKAITLRRNELASLPSGSRAYDLWRIFKEQHNSSKKILYIIFGVEQQQNQLCLLEAAEEIPEIQKMLSKYTISQMQKAQTLLRQIVTDQILLMPREALKSLCKITRFDEFYVYFKVFMDELREGGISRRVTKERKIRFLESPIPSN